METGRIHFEVIASRSYHAERQGKFIAGPFSDFRWQQMRIIAEFIGNTVADAMGLDRFQAEYVLGIYDNGEEMIPTVRAILADSERLGIEHVQALVQQASMAITQANQIQSQLFENMLDPHCLEMVSTNAQEFLEKRGGERMSVPVEIGIAGTIIGRMQGAFAPRPPDILANDRIQQRKAIVITLHSEKREGEARDIQDRKIICFRFADRHKVPLCESLTYDQTIQLQLEETLDAAGKKMLAVTAVRSKLAHDDEFALE